MARQQELDHLRHDCSATLEEFVAEARKAERQMQDLQLPVSVADDLEFTQQRRAEFQACHVYLMAAHRLDDFLKQKLELIQ
jgi:hypothetical protein